MLGKALENAAPENRDMRANFSELVTRGGGDTPRDPLLSEGRPLVVDVDEVLLQANSFPGEVLSEITRRFEAVTGAVLGVFTVLSVGQPG